VPPRANGTPRRGQEPRRGASAEVPPADGSGREDDRTRGFGGIGDARAYTPRGRTAFVLDYSWGLAGTALGAALQIVNTFVIPDSDYNDALSREVGFFVYDGGNRPEWYSIQGGQWTSSTQWSGTLFRTTGPAFSSSFDASQVAYSQVGSASLDFTQVPGQEGRARFTYSIGNTSVTKTITRLPL